MIRSSALAGLPRSQIVSRVAEAMFRQAESAGAFERGAGLLGPWLYERDAEQLVAAELDAEDGGGSPAHDLVRIARSIPPPRRAGLEP